PRPSASLRTTATPAVAPTPTTTPTPTTIPTPTLAPAAAPAVAPAGRWIPPLGNVPWQWEIDHPLDLGSASDMGTGVTTYGGAAAPNPVVYDIDGFDNSAATVAALHARGFHVICYIEVGAAENYRPDYSQFPASTLGNALQGYPNERYLDIRSSAVVGVIENRIAMCAQKGFDAIEPDIDDSYTENTGFGLTMADDVAFNRTLANYAHGLGLSYGLKNGDDPSYAAQMLPIVDFALDEQCFEYSTCGAFFPSFRNAGKAVFEVEYNIGTPSFCPQAVSDGFNAVRQNVNLNGGRQPCS
ncbi:MAG TPA: endo alpha-1,4 polygalactosaminidase, partial [Isosphaeraceae bacterium]|nr:endo alpha-1,4 polygalactosaminidase [Isosphaeraceae bacterium]